MKSKLTLIVDGNWLLMSRLSVLNNKYVDDDEMTKNLKLMMIKSMNIVLRQFPAIDNILFVTDGGSWRNKLDIPESLKKEGIEYKGTRVRSQDIDWTKVFAEYEDFIAKLNSSGITSCREIGVEGDDWCYYWSKYLNANGTNCIIWSKDRDLTQLVNIDKNMTFTVWWNKDTGIITQKIDAEDPFDFLFNSKYNVNSSIYNDVLNEAKNCTEIDPKSVVIDKIIKGDGSDNIQPIILRKAKSSTSEKKYKVSTKDIDYNLNISNIDDVSSYIKNLINSKNYIGRIDKTYDEIMEHFEYNKKLVWLDESSYPDYILDIFKKYKDINVSKDLTIAESLITAEKNEINNILDFI